MKQLFTLSAAVLCGIGAYAQHAQKPVNALIGKPAAATKAVTPGATPAKTTGADTRLIASVNATYGTSSWEVDDSVVVTYTGNNGWDYATEDWKFDSGKVYVLTPPSTWDVLGKVYQTISNNRITSRLFQEFTGSVWEDDEKTTYTYTNGLIATETSEYNTGAGLEPSSRSSNTYNGDNQITENVQESWNSTTMQWEKNMRSLNHYNTAKQVDTTWMQGWIGMTSQWMDNMRSLYTYSGGQLTQVLQQNYTGTWDDAYRTTYTYDGSGRLTSFENEQWNTSTSSWQKTYRVESAYNTAGDVASEISSNWNGSAFQNQSKSSYTYNQYHRLLTEESQSWNNSTSQWYYDSGDDFLTRNYYEAYTNDVKTVASNRAELKVFPVPAKEQINISASFQQMQPVNVTIVDMGGRVVKQLTDQAGTQYRRSINVADLPSGNYMINISGTTEVASKIITVGN